MSFDIPQDNREQTLVYKSVGDRTIALTFLPPITTVSKYAPVYFIIPGGGWHMEKRADMLAFSSLSVQLLRESGFAAVSIDYRVSDEEGITMEEILSDCFDAGRYLSHFREILKINTEKLAVSGHSAGGHLALMLAYAPHDMFTKDSVLQEDFSVFAVAPVSAPTILYDIAEGPTLGFATGHVFRGCDTEEMRKKTSPYQYAGPECPPTLLCAGTSDRLVYSNSSELLHKKLLENGAVSHLILSVGAGHCIEQMHDGIVPAPSYDEIQRSIAAFIKKNL